MSPTAVSASGTLATPNRIGRAASTSGKCFRGYLDAEGIAADTSRKNAQQ